MGDEGESEVYDLRLTAIKCTKKVLYDLLEAISMASKRLIKLRVSNIDINDIVLMTKMNETIYALPQLVELNLSSLKMNGSKLADLMQNIEHTCTNLSVLNISYNVLPTQESYHRKFMNSLLSIISESHKLIDLNISGMNLRNNIRNLMWPLARSRVLQAIHLSDNNLNAVTLSHVHLVFGIKDAAEKINLDSVTTCAIEAPMPRTMTSRQLEMQRIEKTKDNGGDVH